MPTCRGTGRKAIVFITITGRLQAQSELGLADEGLACTVMAPRIVVEVVKGLWTVLGGCGRPGHHLGMSRGSLCSDAQMRGCGGDASGGTGLW